MEQTSTSKLSARKQIARSLRPWRFRVFAANFAAVLLGLLAALMGVLIGPALKLLLTPTEGLLTWKELFGSVWAESLSPYLQGSGVAAAQIYYVLPFALVAVATFKSALTFWQWLTWEKLGERLAYEWRQDLVDSFVLVSPGQRDDGMIARAEAHLGGLISQDIRTCRDYVVHYFGGLPREGFQVVFMAISLLVLSPKLFFIFFFCLAPIGGVLNRLGKKLRRRASAALEDNSILGEWIQQRLLGLETIKQFRTENSEVQSMQSSSQDLFERFFRAARLKARTSPLIEFLGVFAMSVVLAIAFHDIAAGDLSGSVAMSFFSTLALLAQSAAKLGRYFNSNREGIAAADRIFDAIGGFRAASLKDVRSSEFGTGAENSVLELKDVTLRYNEAAALKNFTYRFQSGKIYCLIGRSGAGKSSVFNAILGLRPLSTGGIGGTIARQFDDRTLDLAYLPQQVPIIPAKIGEVISYPFSSYDLVRAQHALQTVQFSLANDRLPLGLDTMVGPGALQLSGGQLQRLQLARLVYHHAPFVLVDEGTSALDPELEKVILDFVRDLARKGTVVLMIAHRRAAVDVSDELLLLEDGQLVAAGAKSEVLQSGVFKELFR
jgi:ABC-type multidrug transport system fused ATPase/permease subunit